MSDKPVICIGWPTIAKLAHGMTVDLESAALIPDDLLHNQAAQLRNNDARRLVAGALYEFCGYLTALENPITVGSKHPVSNLLAALTAWASADAKPAKWLEDADVEGWDRILVDPV